MLDYLGTLDRPAAVALADRAIQRGWLRAEDVSHRLATYSGRSGNAVLRHLAEALSDGAAAESERVLHRLLRHADLTGWRPNFDVWLEGELIAVIDVAFPQLRIAIEVDGHAYHSDVAQFRRDRQRQNALVALGWTVLRFTWADLNERPGYVVATVRRILATATPTAGRNCPPGEHFRP